ALLTIVQRYTRESGVRNLEREISSICRKVAREMLKKEKDKAYSITARTVQKLLGPPPFRHSQIEEKDQVGLVTGLAWTQVGGELLAVESLIMPGKGKNLVTGKLGDVMKESAQAALSYIRFRSLDLGISPQEILSRDIHVHVPAGATPKDGPSAGIAIMTAMVSALSAKPPLPAVAMTGEITLTGRVLPIGGLREKLLAAKRAAIKKVVIPSLNIPDLKEIPHYVTKGLEILPVENVDGALEAIFGKGVFSMTSARGRKSPGRKREAGHAKR
ncbi:MAG: endopeptidase La, partial [bacterium]